MARRKTARRKADDSAGAYPAWTSPIKPAPGDLRIVQAFISTTDREKGTDELASPQHLVDWLARWRLASMDTELTMDDVERTVAVRESLRALVRASGGVAVNAKILEPLNLAASESPLYFHFEAIGTTRFEFGGGLSGAFGRLFKIIDTALREDRWTRIKICANPDCQKIFYDHAPNRVGRWCTQNLCGSRIHSRNFRRRHPRFYK